MAIDKACQALLPKVEERVDRAALAPALREMGPGLKPEMLPRMAAFLLNQNDTKLKPEVKLSLAVSGWLWGPTGLHRFAADGVGVAAARTGAGLLDRAGQGQTRLEASGDPFRSLGPAGPAGRAWPPT